VERAHSAEWRRFLPWFALSYFEKESPHKLFKALKAENQAGIPHLKEVLRLSLWI